MKNLIFVFGLVLLAFSCKNAPQQKADNGLQVAKNLYEHYLEGEISKCALDGKTYWIGALNAPDAGSEIYDASGKKVGVCYHSTNTVDDLCGQLDASGNCEVVYRMGKNIWGKEAVDKYGLGD